MCKEISFNSIKNEITYNYSLINHIYIYLSVWKQMINSKKNYSC